VSGPSSGEVSGVVSDACANRQQIKCLTIVVEFTGECLVIDPAGSILLRSMNELLGRLTSAHGAPRYLRPDNSPESVSRVILQ